MNENKKEGFLIGFVKYMLPVLVVVGAIVVAVVLVNSKTKPAEKELSKMLPKVEIVEVHREDIRLSVFTQGAVAARTSTLLFSKVTGEVQWISPALYSGGFFKKGDLLANIEPINYKAAVANAKSMVAQANFLYQQEVALSEQAKIDWDDMGKGTPTDLVLRKPQLAKALADLESAKAGLDVAEYNLRSTEILAPYDGRVSEKFVDIGQNVTANMSQLAGIYATDIAEIRVSLSQEEASLLTLPEIYEGQSSVAGDHPTAVVSVNYGGKQHQWIGKLDRTEGMIDARTRLVYAIVQVENPYQINDTNAQTPLKVGMFASVEIEGMLVEDAIRIPRGALKPGDLVYTLNTDNQLHINEVTVIKRGIDSVVIGEGLNDNDRVILTPIQIVVEGMELEPVVSSAESDAAGN